MKKTWVKLLILLMTLGGTATALFFVWASDAVMKSLPMAELTHEERVKIEAMTSPAHGPGSGHGEVKAAGHAGRKLSSASSGGLPLVSFDELFANVMANQYSRSLSLKLELELFDEEHRTLVDERQSAVKDTVLATAREQDYFRLSTISGKLYFKELLVGRINQYFKKPVVKDVHFSSFFLQ